MKKNYHGPKSPLPGHGLPEPLLEPGLGVGHDVKGLLDGPLPIGSCRAQPEAGTSKLLPMGSPPAGGAKGLGAGSFGSQPKAGTLAVRSWAAEASFSDLECHLSDGEGTRAGARD